MYEGLKKEEEELSRELRRDFSHTLSSQDCWQAPCSRCQGRDVQRTDPEDPSQTGSSQGHRTRVQGCGDQKWHRGGAEMRKEDGDKLHVRQVMNRYLGNHYREEKI